MIFQKRIDRILNHLKERSEEKKSEGYALEKGDLSSMIFSALIIIRPIARVILLIMVGIGALWIL